MKKEDIDFIKSLDPSCTDGTIQFFLMEEKFKVAPFEEVAKHLLRQLIREKRYLVEQNTELSVGGASDSR